MFGRMQVRRISETRVTAPVGYLSSTRSRVMRVTAEDSWPSGRVEFSVSRTSLRPASKTSCSIPSSLSSSAVSMSWLRVMGEEELICESCSSVALPRMRFTQLRRMDSSCSKACFMSSSTTLLTLVSTLL